jgi:tetratricopeptide (TPR) repeat protein
MRKIIALWSFTLLVSLLASTSATSAGARPQHLWGWTLVHQLNAPAQAAPAKNWKSRDEYDAFNAMLNEKDPAKKVSLAEAFLQKYSNSDFKDGAYMAEMMAYRQLNQAEKAVEAAQKAVEANPDSLDALQYLSFVFPFVYKPDAADAAAKLSQAEGYAKHGLEILQKAQKPANVPEDQFNQVIKGYRAVFNGAVGFAALQRKDYASAITAYKAASQDNPSDWYVFYRMGLAYLYANPHDFNNGIWDIARAYKLASAANDPNAAEFNNYLKRTYTNYHGNEDGLNDIVTQAASLASPPDGFKITPMEAPKHTGNTLVDQFNDTFFPLKFGGDTADKTWAGLKGQPFEFGGVVDSVEKGTEAGTYMVRIDVLDESKATPGVYDIVVKDSRQPNAKNLAAGDVVRFKGTLDSYASSPNLMITVVGQITEPDPLPDKPPEKAKPKPAPAHRRTTRTTAQ